LWDSSQPYVFMTTAFVMRRPSTASVFLSMNSLKSRFLKLRLWPRRWDTYISRPSGYAALIILSRIGPNCLSNLCSRSRSAYSLRTSSSAWLLISIISRSLKSV